MRLRTSLIITLVVLLTLAILLAWWAYRRLTPAIANLRPVLEHELGAQLNRKVSIDSARIVSSNRMVIDGLRVAQGRSFKQGTLFSARRVTADVSTFSIILGSSSVLANVRRVTFTDPKLTLMRDRQGVWSIDDLLHRPPTPPAQRFGGIIRVDSGTITISDLAALLPRSPAVNSVSSVNGTIDLRPLDVADINLTAVGMRGRIGRLSLRGPLGIGVPRLTDMVATVSGANAGYWLDYFSTIRAWTLVGGTANGTATIYQTADNRFSARGSARVIGSSITSPYLTIPLRPVDADISFVGTTIELTGDARLRDSPVRVTGRILNDQALDLRVSSDRMDPRTLQRAVRGLPVIPNSRWTSPISFTASVFGPHENIVIRANASISRAVVYGIPVAGVTASGTYAGGVLTISDLRTRLAGGMGRFSVVARVPTGRITVVGAQNGIRMAQLPIGGTAPITGTADARLTVEWLHGIRSGSVTVTARRGSIRGLAFSTAAARATLAGTTISISRVAINTARGTIRASGTATTAGGLNLAVSANGVDLRTLLVPLGYRQVSGIASFDGRLTGTASAPVLIGVLSARNGHLQQIAFDYLHGRITATPRSVILTDATIRRQGTEIATTGFVRIARGLAPQFQLTVTGRQIELAQLAALTGITIRATGTADVSLRVTGTYPYLRVAGSVVVANATIAGFAVDSARLILRTVDGTTVIDELVATRGNERVVGSGSIGRTGALNILLRGENLNLDLLSPTLSPYAVVSGPMEFTGTVTGTIRRPQVRGRLLSTTLQVNQVPFDRLAGTLTWNGTTLSLLDASLTRADIHYRITRLSLDTRTDNVVFDTDVTDARLERVLALFRNSPYLATPAGEALRNALATVPANSAGLLNASLRVSGRIGDVSGTGRITGTGIVLGAQTINALDIGFVAQRSRFSLSDLTVRSPGVDLTASAHFVMAEPTSFTVQITNTQVADLVSLVENLPFLSVFGLGQGLVAAARSIPEPISGLMNATVSVADIRTGATGTISASIADLVVQDQTIGQVTADADLADGVTTIRQLSITGPQGTTTVQGTVNPKQVIDITGHVEGMKLSLLAGLVGIPGLTGLLSGDFRATGPVEDLTINASLVGSDVNTGQMRFETVTVTKLVIGAGRLTAADITAVTDGSRILASASLPFSWEAPFIPRDRPIDIRLSIPTQDLAGLAQFISLVQSASGMITMNISVTGTIDNPVSTGSLMVTNGRLNVARFNNDFTDIEVDASFSDSTLQINRFTGASSLGGTFTVTGNVQLPSLSRAVVNATLTMDALQLDTDNLTGVYKERLVMTTTGLLNITESLRAPLIAGDLVVSDAVLRAPTGTLPTPAPGTAPPRLNPRFDVTLNLASNVKIQRGPLNATVEGPVSVAGTLSQPNIVGTVALTAGSLNYPGRLFTLVPGGSATFVWQAPSPPSIAVDLTAITRVVAQSPFTGAFTRYTIYLYVSGTIDNLVINTSSSPPGLTDQEALALVFGQAEIEALLSGIPFQQVVEQQLADTLLGLALPGIFQGVPVGPLTVGLTPGITVPLQAWVTLQVTDKLAFSFLETIVAGTPFQILEVSYTLSPQYSFAVQFQQNEEVLYLMQAGWRW